MARTLAANVRRERMRTARRKGKHTQDQWHALVAHCGNRCVICGATGRSLERDHILPICHGGSDSIRNIQPVCSSCNSRKGLDGKDHRPSGWEGAVL